MKQYDNDDEKHRILLYDMNQKLEILRLTLNVGRIVQYSCLT